MKRNIIAVFLAIALCLSLAVTASAQPPSAFVVDEVGYLTDSEIDMLNATASELYDASGVGIFFVYTAADDLFEYDISALVGTEEDYYIMIENGQSWHVFKNGLGNIVGYDIERQLRAIYTDADTYVDGVSDFLNVTSRYFSMILDIIGADKLPADVFVVDDADLLTAGEEAVLNSKLLTFSSEYNAQIMVVAMDSLKGIGIDDYVEFYYDIKALGYGNRRDGVLLLIGMDVRKYRILSNGFAADAITPDAIDAIGDAIVSDLSNGDYADAFDEFADQCVYYIDGHINGFPFDYGTNLWYSLIMGLMAGVVVAFVLWGQLKSVHSQHRAHNYLKPGSMQVTYSNDIFLYSRISTQKRENDDSSGGSSRSSDDSSRNVGGGSF